MGLLRTSGLLLHKFLIPALSRSVKFCCFWTGRAHRILSSSGTAYRGYTPGSSGASPTGAVYFRGGGLWTRAEGVTMVRLKKKLPSLAWGICFLFLFAARDALYPSCSSVLACLSVFFVCLVYQSCLVHVSIQLSIFFDDFSLSSSPSHARCPLCFQVHLSMASVFKKRSSKTATSSDTGEDGACQSGGTLQTGT